MPSNSVDIDSLVSRVSSLKIDVTTQRSPATKHKSLKVSPLATVDRVDQHSVPIDGIVVYSNKRDNIYYVLDASRNATRACYYRIDDNSNNTGKGKSNTRKHEELHVCSRIKILSSVTCTKKSDIKLKLDISVSNRVLDFTAEESTAEKEETMAVLKVKETHLKCVSGQFKYPQTVFMKTKSTNGVKKLDMVIGQLEKLPPFYKEIMFDGDNLFYTKDYEAEKLYKKALAKYLAAPKSYTCPCVPLGPLAVHSARQLTEDEEQYVRSIGCRVPGELTLDQAQRYISEPLVAATRLEDYLHHVLMQRYTVKTPFKLKKMGNGYSIAVRLNAWQTLNCIKSVSTETWRVGSDLVFGHPRSGRWKAPVVIKTLRMLDNNKHCLVFLEPLKRSNAFFDSLFKWLKTGELNEGYCSLGPLDLFAESLPSFSDMVSNRFAGFFEEQRSLFDAWCGRGSTRLSSAPPVVPKLTESFSVRGRPLDPSQLASMRTASAVAGYTCIAAPPGSGKTFTISALVGNRAYDEKDRGEKKLSGVRFVVSATTNVAVTNAIETVHGNFPALKVCRKYSQQLEAELSKEAAEISLKRMAMAAIGSPKSTPRMSRAVENLYKAQALEVVDVKSALEKLEAIKRAEDGVTAAFLEMHDPMVLGSTTYLIALNKNEAVTHLVLDEAAQMPLLSALAVYTALPNLTHVTLLGDSKQLGPHCILEGEGLAKSLLMMGELTRLQQLSTVTQQRFNRLQPFFKRCHPTIVDIWLRPLYGKGIIAGVTAADRNLAASKKLPMAKNGAPCLLVHLKNSVCDNGRNEVEATTALKLVRDLELRGVKGEDVVIITHHRAQRELLMGRLKGTGSIGPLRQAVGVYTIDSFQGKEAKVVIVLTTKAGTSDHMKIEVVKSMFSFVSHQNRETVAVSRAQHAMYILGDWNGLAKTEFWNQFGQKMIDAGAVVDSDFVPILQPGWFQAPPNRNTTATRAARKTAAVSTATATKRRNRNLKPVLNTTTTTTTSATLAAGAAASTRHQKNMLKEKAPLNAATTAAASAPIGGTPTTAAAAPTEHKKRNTLKRVSKLNVGAAVTITDVSAEKKATNVKRSEDRNAKVPKTSQRENNDHARQKSAQKSQRENNDHARQKSAQKSQRENNDHARQKSAQKSQRENNDHARQKSAQKSQRENNDHARQKSAQKSQRENNDHAPQQSLQNCSLQ